jgi:hypothetical protein
MMWVCDQTLLACKEHAVFLTAASMCCCLELLHGGIQLEDSTQFRKCSMQLTTGRMFFH